MKVQCIELKAAVATSDFRILELYTAKCKSGAFLEDKKETGKIHFLLRECAVGPTG